MARIVIHEVGPRDGLQMEKQVVPIEKKEAWIRGLMESGVDIIQVGSFVHPEKVPQMADTDELFRRLTTGRQPPVVLSGLVLNEKGLERGLKCGVEMFCMGASASETHSLKNAGMGTEEATRRIVGAAKEAVAAGKKVQVSVQSAFGCGFEGPIAEERVLGMVRAYLEAGLRNISLADTAGHAHPAQVERLFGAIGGMDAAVECACHFHNTYGLGMANIHAAMRAGVTSYETSFAGLGGCPFTRVAAGNVATEDFVHALQRQGLRADVNLDRLIDVARDVAAHFGRDLQGFVYKTGPIPMKEPA
jgi:hydroxymethylglutaryl-CoA lyase